MKINVGQLHNRTIAQQKAVTAEGTHAQTRRVFMTPVDRIVDLYTATDYQTFEFYRVNAIAVYYVFIHTLINQKQKYGKICE